MLNEWTFGEFITAKRKQAKISLREFAKMTSFSPAYISQIESGKRPAPALNSQNKIADILNLCEADRIVMFDLAAKTKTRNPIPADIAEYIKNDEQVQLFLRYAINNKYIGMDLLKLLRNGNEL